MQYLLSSTAVLILVASVGAQNITATVNDSRSHGVVADNLLSLDEAIRVANGTLTTQALSAAERAQFAGIGTLTTIEVRGSITPVITLEREITPVTGIPGAGADLVINGVQGNGGPALVAGAFNYGLALKTNRAQVLGLAIRGGRVGIEADTTANLSLGVFGIISDIAFAAQTEAGLRLRTPNDQAGRRLLLKVRRCQFPGLPVGIDIRSDSDFGNIDVEGEWLTFAGCATGVDLQSNAVGGRHQWQCFRSNITGGDYCWRLRRALGNDTEWLIRAVYGDYFARRTAFEVDGSTGADTVFHHHQVNVRGGFGSGDYALLTRPLSGRFDLHGSENVIEGNVLIQSGRLSRRTWFLNNHFQNGTFAISDDGVQPDLQWNVFASTPVTVLSTNTQPTRFVDCEFVRSPINDTTTAAVMSTLIGCYQAASPTTGNVMVQNPASASWTGVASVTPVDPPRGGFVDLTLALQPGTAGIWWLGFSEPRPVTSNYPYRYYLTTSSAVVIPGILVGQSRVRLTIPPQAYLVGVEFHAQPLVALMLGQTYGQALAMPRGGRFQLQ